MFASSLALPQKVFIFELSKDLSTISFLHGLKVQIWSDNATNLVGARSERMELRRLFLSEDHQKDHHTYRPFYLPIMSSRFCCRNYLPFVYPCRGHHDFYKKH